MKKLAMSSEASRSDEGGKSGRARVVCRGDERLKLCSVGTRNVLRGVDHDDVESLKAMSVEL